ncbi:MAG: hypothetical protein OXM01_07305 [Gemmatimonadota bacterium]|nr:hypothetical protein [Gemmatimonadota bacterium]
MTPPQQKRCQAPGCKKTIPQERLRYSAKTCSEDCGVAHRKNTNSRRNRHQRQAAGCAWQGVPYDYHLRLSCSRPLKEWLDASIPQGQTAAAWVREMLVTLMRTRGGFGMWALNELVAIAPQDNDEHEADTAHGSQALYSDIPSLLWDSIRQRATGEGFKAAPWLRRAVCTAVQTTEHWRPQTPAQQFKLAYVAFCVAGRTDEFFQQVADSLMNHRSDGSFHDDKIPRYSRWMVSPADLSDHPILLRDRASVPKHVLFDKLPDLLIRLYDEGRRSKDIELLFVSAILDQCDPRVGGAVFR